MFTDSVRLFGHLLNIGLAFFCSHLGGEKIGKCDLHKPRDSRTYGMLDAMQNVCKRSKYDKYDKHNYVAKAGEINEISIEIEEIGAK